ncbi:SusC/RagA family TonB-linked outer membrane protein [Pontibacter harenae]|uniref:SusC/RagA family TonB-linked outer membrane protein n=1 Tax=Pontibacter harenae TaxID=2894083 RepID=UPI001E60A8F1|nr:TonB-dependent receptor [Pontibacter harenae]MCC9167912.1 TonB-dependent receptor [Pontibacter harenae]
MKKHLCILFLRLTMRIFIIGFIAYVGTSISFASEVKGQDLRETFVRFDRQSPTVESLFHEVEKQTQFKFSYKSDLDLRQTVRLPKREIDLESLLQSVSKRTGFTFKQINYTIGVNIRPVESPGAKQIKDITVRGKITDEKGVALPGATVSVEGTAKGTVTDSDGNYILDINSDAVLVASYLGYVTQRIQVQGREVLNIALIEDNAALDEVVVVGFGTQRKASLVGAQSSVEAEALQVPTANLTNALAGRISGVIGVQRTGEPGFDDSDIWIRGISTFSQGLSKPLVLVDGTPRAMANVDPEDIESFTVLKDASATAVYGVRGANGVVIIKTKRGTPGKPKFSFRYYEGVTKFTKLPEFADGPTYMRMSNEAIVNRGGAPIYSNEAISMTEQGTDPYLYPNVDWMDALFNDFGHQRRANLNISGGSESATYYVGTSFFDEVGLYKQGDLVDYNNQIGYKRYNLTTNLSVKASSTTKVDLGVQGYLANANYPGAGQATIFEKAYYVTPIIHPVHYENGEIADQRSGALDNPYGNLTATGYANQWRNQLFSNLRVTQDLPMVLDGLSATAMFSFDVYNYTSMRRTKRPDTFLATGRDENGNMLYEETYRGERYLNFSRNSTGERTIYFEGALNYEKFFKKHEVKGMLLYNQSDMLNSQAGDFNSSLPYRYMGVSGRGTYGYDNKYFLELNFGYNGSENFAPSKRFGFFPSVGLGWVVSEEKFFEPISGVFPMAKLRFSHGIVGNSQITGRRFAYLSTVGSTTGYSFGKDRGNNYGGYDIGEYGVDVSWETATKTNVGIDLYSLNSDLNLQVDYFEELREGIFLNRSAVPAYVGLQKAPYGNLGIIENKGIDASLTYSKRFNDFFLQAIGNFTFSRNKIIDNDQPSPTYPWLDQRGRKVGQRFGLKALGLFETEEEIANGPLHTGTVQPGDIMFQDVNGDGKIDDFDRVPIGYGTIPEIVYGFGLTLGYKNITLSSLFQGVGNVDIYMNGEGVTPFSVSMSRGNLLSNIEDRWTVDNPRQDVFYPRLSDGSPNNNYATSTWWLKNGRYLRLKNVQLSYGLPKAFAQRLKLDNASIFLAGFNVFTWSPFKFWDVELGDGRGTGYPNIASYTLGVDLKF